MWKDNEVKSGPSYREVNRINVKRDHKKGQCDMTFHSRELPWQTVSGKRNNDNYGLFTVLGTIRNAIHESLMLTKTLWDKYNAYIHFTGQETET